MAYSGPTISCDSHIVEVPEIFAGLDKRFGDEAPGIVDSVKRIDDQTLDGVDAEVLLPSVLLGLNTIPNADIVAATYRNYNDWVYNYASQAPKRLFPTCCLPMHGANLPCVPPPDRPYSDPSYNPFWAEAERLQMPLVMHFLTSTQPNHGLPQGMTMGTGYGLASFAVQRVIVDIIGG